MDLSSQPHRRSLDRIRGVLEKVHKVLGDLDERRDEAAALHRARGTVRAGRVQAAQGNDLLRPHEAARRLGVPLRDVYAAVRDGHLPSTRIGRFLWFRGDDVDAFAEASRRAAPKRRRP